MGVFSPGDEIKGASIYRVLRLLGEGGMNRVYLVEEKKSGSKWAMKVTKKPAEINSSQKEIFAKFLREVSMLTELSHPGLPRVEEYFVIGDEYLIIEEFVRGVTLEKHCRVKCPDESEVIDWALRICGILEYLHEKKVIFRDLKPANIILKRSGKLKLIDFDIARFYRNGQKYDTELLGTPGYAAPECYGKSQSDARSDIYSFGATLHNLLTGIDPENTPFQFEPIEKIRRDTSASLIKIVNKALSLKPKDRFQSIAEMRKKLLRLEEDCAQTAARQSAKASGSPSRIAVAYKNMMQDVGVLDFMKWYSSLNTIERYVLITIVVFITVVILMVTFYPTIR